VKTIAMTGTGRTHQGRRWLLALLIALSGEVWSQSQSAAETKSAANIWHVEVLLFAHRPGDTAWREQQALQDFRQLPVMPAVLMPAIERTSSDSSDLFASAVMAKAWRSLQRGHDVLGYYRWHQQDGIGRRWRIHGTEALTSTDMKDGRKSPTINLPAAAVVELNGLDPGAVNAADSRPQAQFVLDGSIKINTGNIGVAALDLRERSRVLYYRNEEHGDAAETGVDPGYRVRMLQQQRRIQAGRMEYFDSSGLAALVLISKVPAAANEAAHQAATATVTE